MRPKSLLYCAALSLLAGPLLAKPFEGVVTYKATHGSDEPREMTLSIAGGKWRMDTRSAQGGGAVIVDPKAHSSVMLMEDRQMYMRHVYEPRPPKAGRKPKIRKTGKSDSIAGYRADEWEVVTEGKSASVWATKDLGQALFSMDGGPKGENTGFEIPETLKRDGFFPLRMEGHGSKMEATKVEAKSLDPSLFEVPSGYKEMKMGGLPGGMKTMSPEQIEMIKKLTHKENQ